MTGGGVALVLEDLPIEIQIDILSILSVPDVLAVRQTNKFYHLLSNDRAIWLNVLKTQCLENDVPLLTFEFELMGRSELEQNACRGLRAELKLESDDPTFKAHRHLNLGADDPSPSAISVFELVPGGRFLLTGNYGGALRCWDLWSHPSQVPTSDDDHTMLPCAEYIFPKSQIVGMWTQRSVESPSIVISSVEVECTGAMLGTHEDADECKMVIVRLSLETMTFEVLNETVFLDWYCMWIMDGDIVTVVDEAVNIYIWNWRKSSWTYLVTELVPLADHPRQGILNVLLMNRHIAIFTQLPEGGVRCNLYHHAADSDGLDLTSTYPTWELAWQNKIDSIPLTHTCQLSNDGIDIDFALCWRPYSMFPSRLRDEPLTAASFAEFLVATYPSATRIIPLDVDSLTTLCSNSELPNAIDPATEDPVIVTTDHIPITFLDKKDPGDHLPIFPGIRSSHICWMNGNRQWMILQRRRDGKAIPGCANPRLLGDVTSESSRLLISVLSGNAFFTLDGSENGLEVWDFLDVMKTVPEESGCDYSFK